MSFLLRVSCAVIVENHKILITKRLKKSPQGHLWEFPGGKIENGESPEQCVIRECYEEIRLHIKPLRLIKEITHSYPQLDLKLYFYLSHVLSGNIELIECSDYRWVDPSELVHFSFPEADRELILELSSSQLI